MDRKADVEAMLITWRDKAIDECRAIWDERIENQYQQIQVLRSKNAALVGLVREMVSSHELTRDICNDDGCCVEARELIARARDAVAKGGG